MNEKEFWDIVNSIGWKKLCKNEDYLKKSKEKAKKIYKDKDAKWANSVFKEIRKREDELDKVLKKIWLSNVWDEKGKFVSDDSYWDLKAHIVGCGKEAFDKAKDNPKTVFDDYIEKDNYKENFEYWTHEWDNDEEKQNED